MKKENFINAFHQLSLVLERLGDNQPWVGFELGITEEEYNNLQVIITKQIHFNGWFTQDSVRTALQAWGKHLKREKLSSWLENYSFSSDPKKVGIIMAGNIPLVGFHDLVSVILSGHIAKVKLSSDDKSLIPALLNVLIQFNPEINSHFEISSYKLGEIDAIIATGSNNSMNYFESYFGKYPHIFRKNRTSIAIINGTESKSELEQIGKDIFTYYGLGCRNVSQLLIPQDFNIDLVFEALYPYHDIVNHNKYANNYDYNKAIFLMNQESLLDNGFILLKESKELFSPLAMLYFSRYANEKELNDYIDKNIDSIQVIVGKKYTPFGKAQEPELHNYADGIDTMNWLNSI